MSEALEIARFCWPDLPWCIVPDGAFVPSPNERWWLPSEWGDVHAAELALIERGLGDALAGALLNTNGVRVLARQMEAQSGDMPTALNNACIFASIEARVAAILKVILEQK